MSQPAEPETGNGWWYVAENPNGLSTAAMIASGVVFFQDHGPMCEHSTRSIARLDPSMLIEWSLAPILTAYFWT